MQDVGKWLYAMTVVSAIGGMAILFFGEKTRLCASLRTVVSLIVLSMLVSPMLTTLQAASDWFSDLSLIRNDTAEHENTSLSSLYEEKSIAYATAASENALRHLLCAKTGILESDMLVTLQTDARDTERVEVTSVKVELLQKKDRITKDKIRAYAEEILGCPCEVTVGGSFDAFFEKGGGLHW